MARSGKATYRDDVYRPQRPKCSRKRKVELFRNRDFGLDGMRKMAEYSRIKPVRMWIQKIDIRNEQKNMDKAGGHAEAKEAHVQFNKGRPPVDREERREVKRNLFGKREERSFLNKKINDKRKIKEKFLRSRQVHHKLLPAFFEEKMNVAPSTGCSIFNDSPNFSQIFTDSPNFSQILEPSSDFSILTQSSFSKFDIPSKTISSNPEFPPFSNFLASSSTFSIEFSLPRMNSNLAYQPRLCSSPELPFHDTAKHSFVDPSYFPPCLDQLPDYTSKVDQIFSSSSLLTSHVSNPVRNEWRESSQWCRGWRDRDSPARQVMIPRVMWGDRVDERSICENLF